MEGILQWAVEVVLWVQQTLGPGVYPFMRGSTWLGYELFFLLLIPSIYWAVDRALGARTLLLLISAGIASTWLKLTFRMPRPYWLEPRVTVWYAAGGSYGFPSGHATTATAMWLFLAHVVKRWWAYGMVACPILLVSLSRVYLGVHFPTDVIAGWVVGGLVVVGFTALERWVQPTLTRQSVGRQVGWVVLASLVVLAVGWMLVWMPGEDPHVWNENAIRVTGHPIHPRTSRGPVTLAGLLLGSGVGLIGERRWVRFRVDGTGWKRGIRLIVGLAGMHAMGWVLTQANASLSGSGRWIGLFFSGVFISLWVTVLAPALFVRLRWAPRDL